MAELAMAALSVAEHRFQCLGFELAKSNTARHQSAMGTSLAGSMMTDLMFDSMRTGTRS